jgi:hypothetical protein
LNSITIIPLSFASYLGVGPITEHLLPNYIEGIDAAKIYSLGSIFLVYFGPSMIIPIVRRNIPLMIGYAFAIVMLWMLGLVFVQEGYGIEGVAWARFIATGFLCVFSLAYSYYLTTLDIKP